MTIEPIQATQTTQTEINGQVNGSYDLTAGDYGTYIDNELAGTAKLRIVARLPSSAERAHAARQGRVTSNDQPAQEQDHLGQRAR